MKKQKKHLNVELEKSYKRQEKCHEKQAELDIRERKIAEGIRILIYLILCTQEQEPEEEEQKEEQAKVKKVIQPQDVDQFFEQASLEYDAAQKGLSIPLKYSWFCIWLSTQYSIRRRRLGMTDSELSPQTVLSYFKRERTNVNTPFKKRE